MTPESEPYIITAFILGMVLGASACLVPMCMTIHTSIKSIKSWGKICDGYVSDINRLVNRIKELEARNDEGEEWKR